jgi:hypothetical protein
MTIRPERTYTRALGGMIISTIKTRGANDRFGGTHSGAARARTRPTPTPPTGQGRCTSPPAGSCGPSECPCPQCPRFHVCMSQRELQLRSVATALYYIVAAVTSVCVYYCSTYYKGVYYAVPITEVCPLRLVQCVSVQGYKRVQTVGDLTRRHGPEQVARQGKGGLQLRRHRLWHGLAASVSRERPKP